MQALHVRKIKAKNTGQLQTNQGFEPYEKLPDDQKRCRPSFNVTSPPMEGNFSIYVVFGK